MIRNHLNKLRTISKVEWAIYLFGVLPLIPNRIKGFPVIFFLIVVLFQSKNFKPKTGQWYLYPLQNTIPYLLLLIGLIYTSNFDFALRKLETGASLLILPFCFLGVNQLKSKLNTNKILINFLRIYLYSTFVYVGILGIFLFQKGLIKYFQDPKFIRHFTEEIPFIGQHSIYASIFLAIGLLVHLFLVLKSVGKSTTILTVVGSLLSLTLLILLASKSVIIGFIIISILLSYKLTKSRIKRLIVISSVLIALVLGLVYAPSLSARMKNLIEASSFSINPENKDSTEIRKMIYYCTYNVMRENWAFGYGTGDVGDVLQECYKSTAEHLYLGQYNSHNQYLNFLIGNGIFGLICFLLFLILNFRLAYLNQSILFTAILGFFCIIMIFENILSRQSGVILFAFLINFLGFTAKSKMSHH